MATVTKAQITDAVNQSIRCDRLGSDQIVESLLDIIKDTLAAGEDLLISGFGKFEVRGKNPTLSAIFPQ